MAKTLCYVGIGANLNNPVQQVVSAINALNNIKLTRLIQKSSLYKSAPMGPQDQPHYINAVAKIETALSAYQLLSELQRIEHDHGRVRGAERWSARTLDLDLLLFGEHIIQNDTLRVPHPGIAQRDFVLYPLHEISPGLEIPNLGKIGLLMAGCGRGDLVKLHDPEYIG